MQAASDAKLRLSPTKPKDGPRCQAKKFARDISTVSLAPCTELAALWSLASYNPAEIKPISRIPRHCAQATEIALHRESSVKYRRNRSGVRFAKRLLVGRRRDSLFTLALRKS